MWPAKKNTIKVYFVLTDGEVDIENASEKMQLAFQVCENINHHYYFFSAKNICA